MPALLAMLLLAMVLAGCSQNRWVTLRSDPKSPLADQLKLFAKGGPRPTERTLLLLRSYDLDRELKGDPCKLAGDLREVIEREPSADKVYALAELAYLGGKKTEGTDPKRALELHAAAVMHAYLYMFDDYYGRTRNPYDPQFRGACDLYNGALESAMRIARKGGALVPNSRQVIPIANQSLELSIALRADGWRAEDIEKFEFVSDYEINGLQNQYHTYGLGVPLIAVCKQHAQPQGHERYYPPGLCFPVTAFLRMAPDRPDQPGRHSAVLELYDPLASSDIMLAGRRVPLETDLSTPLAYQLNHPKLRDMDLATIGLLLPEQSAKIRGLYMLEPYRPDKIPVIMVHGLWSSPITWMEMFNDLRSAPEIRERFQFWFYLYPTGQPFWLSAAQFREDLASMRVTLDPARRNSRLDQMVLVGHSMGGLVSRLQTVESRNDFWSIVSDRPFDSVKAPPNVREALAAEFFFRPNPSIRRVITIGTPHHGSNFANSTTRYLGSKLIKLPHMLASTRRTLERDNPGLLRNGDLIDVTTSIDSLSPHSAFLPVLYEAQPSSRVRYNNIVGKVEDQGFFARFIGLDDPSGSDGVVPVASAHLEYAESEIVVPADHSTVHRHPRSVLEVRRILLAHAAESDRYDPSPLEAPPWVAERPRPASFSNPSGPPPQWSHDRQTAP